MAPSSSFLALPQTLFPLFLLAAEISSGQGVPAKAAWGGGINGQGRGTTLSEMPLCLGPLTPQKMDRSYTCISLYSGKPGREGRR